MAAGSVPVGLRLAVNASIYDGRPSGLGAYTREVVRALHALDNDLVVFTSRPEVLPAFRAISPLGEPSRGLAGHAVRLLWTQTALPLQARRSGSVVLLNTVPEGPIRCSLPQVTVVHDLIPLIFAEEFPRQQWYFRRFVPAVLRASAVVVADSAQTRDDVIAQYGIDPARVAVVTPGVDAQRFRPRSEGARDTAGPGRYLLYVGNLHPHKNLTRLLRAFASVTGGASLVIAGHRDPRYSPALAAEAAALGLDGRVRFLGFVPEETLPQLYAGAAAVVVPSLYEGFGLPVLEAMASGVPVVASSAAGLREAVGTAALLVDPYDVPALAAAIQQALDDRDLRASLRARGLAHAAAFRWDDTARGILSHVAEAARGRTGRPAARTTPGDPGA